MLYSKLLHMQLLSVFLNLTNNDFLCVNDMVYPHRV